MRSIIKRIAGSMVVGAMSLVVVGFAINSISSVLLAIPLMGVSGLIFIESLKG